MQPGRIQSTYNAVTGLFERNAEQERQLREEQKRQWLQRFKQEQMDELNDLSNRGLLTQRKELSQEAANIKKSVLDQKEILRNEVGVKVEEVETENKSGDFARDRICDKSISIDSIDIEYEKKLSKHELRCVTEREFIKDIGFNESHRSGC